MFYPWMQIFTKVSAQLDSNASVLIQATPTLHDEMAFGEGLELEEQPDQSYVARGNWFQLEWAWHYIDCFMQQQVPTAYSLIMSIEKLY